MNELAEIQHILARLKLAQTCVGDAITRLRPTGEQEPGAAVLVGVMHAITALCAEAAQMIAGAAAPAADIDSTTDIPQPFIDACGAEE